MSLPPERRGSVLGAVLGAGAGVWLGLGVAAGFMMKQCGRSCSDERALAFGSVVGLPIGGALLGYYAGSQPRRTIVYCAW